MIVVLTVLKHCVCNTHLHYITVYAVARIVSLSPDLPTSHSTGCIASPRASDAIHPVLWEVGRSGDSETMACMGCSSMVC